MQTPYLQKIDLTRHKLDARSPYLIYYENEEEKNWECGYFYYSYRNCRRGQWIFSGESDRELNSIKAIFRIKKRKNF